MLFCFKIEGTIKKYDTRLPEWLSVYVTVHFIVFLVGYQELMARHGVSTNTINLEYSNYSFSKCSLIEINLGAHWL